MTDNRLRVLVTAVGGAGHGEQILKALRLAPDQRYYIIGGDARSDCPQFALVEKAVTLPLASDPAYVETILDICERLQVRALFHGCEPELRRFSEAREAIRARGIFLPINPASVIDACLDKEASSRMLTGLGFEVPRFLRALSRSDLETVDWFPVVVKPSIGGGGSANVFIAQSRAELLGLADYLGLNTMASTFLVQEYVGRPEDEFTVGVLHDMDGNYLNAIAVHRQLFTQLNLRTVVPNRPTRSALGPKLVVSSGVSQGRVGRFAAVTSQCREIARAIGARGPINIQCRVVKGMVKVFEINPRFSGTTSIRAMAGYNEPDVLLRRHVMGEVIVPDFPYREGDVIRSLVETWVSSR